MSSAGLAQTTTAPGHSPATTTVGSDKPAGVVATSKPARLHDDPRVQRWWFTMGWGVVLIVAFLAGSMAIILFSRRFKTLLKPNRSGPTPSSDVWAMHIPPPIDEEVFEEFENRSDEENGDDMGDDPDFSSDQGPDDEPRAS